MVSVPESDSGQSSSGQSSSGQPEFDCYIVGSENELESLLVSHQAHNTVCVLQDLQDLTHDGWVSRVSVSEEGSSVPNRGCLPVMKNSLFLSTFVV